jgi:hypothetical protein
MSDYPAGSAPEGASADRPAPAPREFEGFDAELAAALEDFGRQVRPREFDSRAILHRTARRRSRQVLGTSAAALAVVAGVTAFAAHVQGPTAAGNAVASTTSSQAATGGTDPLTVPGYFRTAPGGFTPAGFTAYGDTTALASGTPADGGYLSTLVQDTQAGSASHGTVYALDVDWTGGYHAKVSDVTRDPGNVVATVNAHPAYYSPEAMTLAFWAGPAQGYVQAYGWNVTQDYMGITDPTMLVHAAQALDTTSSAVPMPLRVTGLDSAQVLSASLGQTARDPSYAWLADIRLKIDGRTYEISAKPGAAPSPSPAKTLAAGTDSVVSVNFVSATKTVDGLGITVDTAAGDMGSAPTVSQVLAHVSSLGTDPSGWSTSVIVK